MRKWHRWLVVFFGVFLLWISVTGVLSQVVPIVQRGGFEEETVERGRSEAAAVEQAVVPAAQAHDEDELSVTTKSPAAMTGAAPAAAPAAFVCPANMTCRPKPRAGDGRSIVSTLHHLHSGESFGPLGVTISILSGLSLIFFAFSGLWMYIQMWRNRANRGLKPGWFWK
ncbi:PepSY domain-containing protein [Novosphingobium tardum]|uniref:PepSY domain-containing protein n=1 Tax=Novosphingobium tardum TaxID=1538021 RepID=A0ABV8RL74_9SPHN